MSRGRRCWCRGARIGGTGGSGPSPTGSEGFQQAGGQYTVTGSGDIVPVVPGAGAGGSIATISDHLLGAFAALVVLVVIATMFITGEYRRGLIRTTLAATPHRGRVLAAKATVIGGVTFLIGLAASLVAVTVGVHLSRDQGQYVLPVGWLTEARVIAPSGCSPPPPCSASPSAPQPSPPPPAARAARARPTPPSSA